MTDVPMIRKFCEDNDARHSIILAGETFVCSACGKDDCHFEDNWGGLILDHSGHENTYLIGGFCKDCWWRENDMQTPITEIMNEAHRKGVRRRYLGRQKEYDQ